MPLSIRPKALLIAPSRWIRSKQTKHHPEISWALDGLLILISIILVGLALGLAAH